MNLGNKTLAELLFLAGHHLEILRQIGVYVSGHEEWNKYYEPGALFEHVDAARNHHRNALKEMEV